jgi:hypothetical protein
MVRKTDIKEALASKKVFEIARDDYNAFKTFVTLSIREYYTRTGQKAEGNELFLKDTILISCDDLKKHFNYLPIQEFKLALEYGANGVFGDVKHACDATFKFYLTSYLSLPIRAVTLQEFQAEQNKDIKKLDQHKGDEGYDHVEAMRKRWRENLKLVKNGNSIRDTGGLLYDYLKEIGHCEVNEDHKKNVIERLKQAAKNKFDIVSFRLLEQGKKDEKELAIFFQAECLREYFVMEIESIKLKAKKNEKS